MKVNFLKHTFTDVLLRLKNFHITVSGLPLLPGNLKIPEI